MRDPSGPDLGDLVAGLAGLGLAPKTVYLYGRVILRADELLAARGTDFARCGPLDIAEVTEILGPSWSVRVRWRATLRAVCQLLARDDEAKLCRAVRIPPKPRGRCRALDTDQATILEQAAWARDDLPGLAVLLGLYAGLRRMEIAELRWEHVLVDAAGHPDWLRVHGKGSTVAEIPIHPVLAQRLAAWRRPGGGWMFPGRDPRRPVGASTVWSWVRLVATDAGLAEIPPHVLRHTALAEANDRSSDLRTVQEIARHARPETTAGYTRTSAARMRAVVAMIDYGRRAS